MYLKNKDGEDLILYRGECASPDVDRVRSKLPCIYFGCVETANAYADDGHFLMAGRIYPVKLVMKNPFINQPNDPFIEVGQLLGLLGFSRTWDLVLKYAHLIEQTDNWQCVINADNRYDGVADYLKEWPNTKLHKLYFQAYPFFEDLENVQLLIKLGFDGAIHQGSGVGSAHVPEYCVFSKNQIHYLFAEEPVHV